MALTVNSGDITLNIVSFWYTITLNGINKFEIGTDGLDSTYQAEVVPGKTIEIYRGSTKELTGEIENEDTLPAGGSVMRGFGQEKKDLCEHPCPIDTGKHTKTWTSTGDHTIIAALLSGTGWTADVTQSTQTTMDSFRVSDSMSVFQGILSMIAHNGKDIWLDYANSKVWLYDALGSADVMTFNENINCGRVRRTTQKATYSKVIVYGKGDGANQIIGTSGSGTPVRKIIDRNCITTTQANTRAAAEKALIDANIKHYFFEPNNPNVYITVGDTITLNSDSLGEAAILLAVVQVKRGMRGGMEFLQLQVTNTGHRRAKKKQAEVIATGEANARTRNSSMQGSGNTTRYPGMLNANNSVAIAIEFDIDSTYEDEASNLRVESLTLDYDIDPYNSQYGAVSEASETPALDGSTQTVSHKHDAADSGHAHGLPSMTSASFGAYKSDEGSDSAIGTTLNVGWNNSVCTESFTDTIYDYLYIEVVVEADFVNHDFNCGISIDISGTYYVNRIVMNYDTDITTIIIRETFLYPRFQGVSETVDVNVYSSVNDDYNVWLRVYGGGKAHTHDITGYNADSDNAAVADSNKTPGVTGNTVGHDHSVSIGDGVDDASSLNATELSLISLEYYENKAITNNETAGSGVTIEMADTGRIAVNDVVHFNGTNKEWATVSAVTTDTSITATIATNKTAGDKIDWVAKNQITSTGVTKDIDVDLTDSDTYPDVKGTWRVRMLTDNATPDLVKAIVKLKHNLDN